jgi:hypothetical protein
MSSSVCSDGLGISILLSRFDNRQARVKVPNSGNDADRYLGAMSEHLDWIAAFGSDYRDHVCDKCLLIFDNKS